MAKQIFDFVSASAEFHTDFKYQVDSNFYLRAPSSPIIVEITAENCQPMANLKTGVSRKQSMSNFLKNEHFLLPDMHTYVFQKIWRALFSSNTCSEIRSFALLPTKLVSSISWRISWENTILFHLVQPPWNLLFFFKSLKPI